ncbi:MAG TPA: methionyl-tRNA formyltransferase [Candidatus Eisenbacteria bacterium]
MRLVYYGTPALAVPPLLRLNEDGRAPLLVVTRPDKPRGRGLRPVASPVKAAALALGLAVETPARAGEPEALARLRALAPDLLVVAAYGQILPPALLAIPRLGAINVHYSLLPRHRGASPVQAALLAGDGETGVTTMWITEGLDEGPTFLSVKTPIGPAEDAGALGERLAALGASCLAETLDRIERGEIVREAQDPARATYAPKIGPGDARLSSTEAPAAFANRVRAMAPEPGAFLPLAAGRLIVLAATPGRDAPPDGAPPGTVLRVAREAGIEMALLAGSIWLQRVKPEGRRAMTGADYANGARLLPGSRLPISGAGA